MNAFALTYPTALRNSQWKSNSNYSTNQMTIREYYDTHVLNPVSAWSKESIWAARLLGLWVRISPGARRCLSRDCCVLSGRGVCDGLITRPEESYWLRCVVECDLGTSWMRRPWPTGGRGGACRVKNSHNNAHTTHNWTIAELKLCIVRSTEATDGTTCTNIQTLSPPPNTVLTCLALTVTINSEYFSQAALTNWSL